ncbi:ATP-binding protein [Alkalimonas delamerensis]|uniref:histidine kinase n=1 Tax=Alkalimonas delamerensis TaxID=265981 RepID=A0ABT9GND4_9GAMM|nr:GAF domain-containing hybrid sensor histidine kinase/response regulator [Alkalimonas delamerensis]MDP4528486.1 ATP-binding protein [Alkalimonas delamerensis]
MKTDATGSELTDILLAIAERFINVPLAEAELLIADTLEQMGRFVDADRVYIFSYDFERNTCSNTHEWCAEGISAEIEQLQNVSILHIPQWLSAHLQGEQMLYPDVPALPDDDPIKAILAPQGIKSIITIPMRHQGKLIGFVGFDSVRRFHHYDQQERKLLTVFAQMLVNLKERMDTMQLLNTAKQSAESAAQVKAQFLANMSHELRTPLNAITGFSELMQSLDLPAQAKNFNQKIQQASSHLLSVINDILDLSKIEANKLELKPEPVRLSRLMLELDDMMQFQAQRKGLSLQVSVDSALHRPVMLDALRFNQVMINLVGNAIKFTHYGRVTVEFRVLDTDNDAVTLEVAVTDTGIGMSEESIAQLFDAFHQLDTSITRQFGGTGLGLFISQGLLQKMQSALKVQSSPGEGSCFSFQLSLPFAATTELAERPSITPAGQLHGQVLLVEDDSTNRLLLRKMLERLGLSVREAEHGKAALAAVALQEPDIILMDIQMPVMDGLSATELLRQQGFRKPILALSAGVMPEDIERSRTHQLDDHLTKPITLQALRDGLSRWLGSDAQPSISLRLDSLSAMVGQDALAEVLHDYQASLTKTMDEMQTAYRAGDAIALAALCHRLKSSTRFVGADSVALELDAMEKLLRHELRLKPEDYTALWLKLTGLSDVVTVSLGSLRGANS